MYEIAEILCNQKNATHLTELLKRRSDGQVFTGSELAKNITELKIDQSYTLLLLLKTANILIAVQPAPSILDYLLKVNKKVLPDFEKKLQILMRTRPKKNYAKTDLLREKIKIIATLPEVFHKEAVFPKVPSVSSVLAKLITEAEKTIWIINPFFDEYAVEFLQLYLNGAMNRGVQVKIITRYSFKNKSNINAIKYLKDNIEKPERLEIKSFMPSANNKWCAIHSKIIMIDDKACYIGSANITRSSLNLNFEMGVVLTGEVIKKPAEIIKKMWEIGHCI